MGATVTLYRIVGSFDWLDFLFTGDCGSCGFVVSEHQGVGGRNSN